MSTMDLTARSRTETGKGAARTVRREGSVPAILYGGGIEAKSLLLNLKEIHCLVSTNQTYNTILNLKVDEKESQLAVIREVQRNSRTEATLHLDLLRIDKDTKIEVQVPIEFINVESARKRGGSPQVLLDEITAFCLPGKVPERIVVDVEKFKVGATVHISDLEAPEGVEFHNLKADVVLTLLEPKKKGGAGGGVEGEEGLDGEAAEGEGGEAAEDGTQEG